MTVGFENGKYYGLPEAVQLSGHYYDGRRFATANDASYEDLTSELETALGQSLSDCEWVLLGFTASGGSGASWFRVSDDGGTTHHHYVGFAGPNAGQILMLLGDSFGIYRGAGTSDALCHVVAFKLKGTA